MRHRTVHDIILLHSQAPAKPPEGAACNGCGVCCAAAPCPLGIVLSRRSTGTCVALSFDAAQARYRCGALANPTQWLRWLPASWARRLVRRWIASGSGCDSSLQAEAQSPA